VALARFADPDDSESVGLVQNCLIDLSADVWYPIICCAKIANMEKKLLSKVLSQIKHGTLEVTFWDGKTERYGRGQPKAHVSINKKGILRRALRNSSLAFGEAYMDGDITIDEPITNLLKLAELNPMKLGDGRIGKRVRKLHKNKKSKQAKYIAHHYDIGNDFYKLWLDPTMFYSCAYFKNRKDSLETAQHQKVEHILKKLQLKPGLSLLDIGCGWGYTLVWAAKKYKIKGVGVTLSHEQVRFARELAKREDVDKLVKFRYQNYQDIPKTEKYDRLVSIGFLEHVGQNNLDEYFKVVQQNLKPGGISVLHSITHQDESPTDPWIDKYIFPGGYIPSMRETTSLMAEHDFYIFDYENLGQHYGMTLEHWYRAFEKHKKQVIEMYDERFYRMWRLYLLGSMTVFKTGRTHLSQWVFKNGQDPDWPLTREYLYK
jgi:cyclopropane-fatty-acyl-phospholipid synthase